MNPSAFMPIALAAMIIASLLRVALDLIGASRYELSAVQRQRYALRRPQSRRLRRRPPVTVIITTHNDQATIIDCIEAVANNSYRKCQVIIIDHASTDDTKRVIKAYQAAHTTPAIRLVAKRASTNNYQAALTAFKMYGTGEIVLLIRANEYCQPGSINSAVQQFNQQANCQLVLPRQKLAHVRTFTHLLVAYLDFIKNRSHKAKIASQATPILVEKHAVFIRAASLKKGKISFLPAVYAATSLITVEPSSPMRHVGGHAWPAVTRSGLLLSGPGLLSYIRHLMTMFSVLTLPLLITYCLYLAINLHQVVLLLASGLVLTMLLVLAIWDDDQLKPHQKFVYILGIPITYSFFYIFAIVRAAAMLRHSFD